LFFLRILTSVKAYNLRNTVFVSGFNEPANSIREKKIMKRFSITAMLLFVLLAVSMFAAPAFAQDEEACVTISGKPVCGSAEFIAAILLALDDADVDEEIADDPDDLFGTELFLNNVGVLTGDIGDENCKANKSCWGITPDRQYVLNDPDAEGTSVREDAHTMIATAGGRFETTLEDGTTEEIYLEPEEDHLYLLILRGLRDGDGDRNTPVMVTEFDAGFILVTHLPPGKQVSLGYFEKNAANGHTAGNCGLDGCTSVTAYFYDVETGREIAVRQDGLDEGWEVIYRRASR
jgi:hypothetical protein